MGRWVYLTMTAALAGWGCLSSDSVVCRSGLVCPAGTVCDAESESCVGPTDPVCGNGITEAGEECDRGADNADAPGICRVSCLAPRCGDLIVDPGEICDDGNELGGDGCSADCESEEWCGNDYVDFDVKEGCDDGNLKSGDGCDSRCQPELPVWTPVASEVLPDWSSTEAVWDSARDVVVVFGGLAGAQAPGALYEGDGRQWWPRAFDHGPEQRQRHCMAYDPNGQLTILFGGRVGLELSAETWAYDGRSWTLLAPEQAPSPRAGAAMAWDENLGGMLLVGGKDGALGYRNDVWLFADGEWEQLPDGPMPPHSDSAMAFDPLRGTMVLHTGRDHKGGVSASQTWRFDGQSWSLHEGPAPGIAEGRLVHHPVYLEMWLIGGFSGDKENDPDVLDKATERIWVLSDKHDEWTKAEDIALPDTRAGHAALWTPPLKAVMVVGDGAPWSYVGAWAPLADVIGPTGRTHTEAVYHEALAGVVVYGGLDEAPPYTHHGDTWIRPGGSWKQVGLGGASPSPRRNAALVYDPIGERVVLFGGANNEEQLGETWALSVEGDDLRWQQLDLDPEPTPRSGHAMAYDWQRGVIVLYGGQRFGVELNAEHWELDESGWRLVSQSAPPGARAHHDMVYDRLDRRIILHGGLDATRSPKGALPTWELADGQWRELGAGPAVPYGAVVEFDTARAKVILAAADATAPTAEDGIQLWELDGAEWVPLNPLLEAPPVASLGLQGALVYDSALAALRVPRAEAWEMRYVSASPTEICGAPGDEDGDGVDGCDDPDCALQPECGPLAWEDCVDACDQLRCGGAICALGKRCGAGVCR